MKPLSQLAMCLVIVGYALLSSGCIVEPRPDREEVHDERWCANHPHQCDR